MSVLSLTCTHMHRTVVGVPHEVGSKLNQGRAHPPGFQSRSVSDAEPTTWPFSWELMVWAWSVPAKKEPEPFHGEFKLLWASAKTYGPPHINSNIFHAFSGGLSFKPFRVFRLIAKVSCSRDNTGTILKANEKLYTFFFHFLLPGRSAVPF